MLYFFQASIKFLKPILDRVQKATTQILNTEIQDLNNNNSKNTGKLKHEYSGMTTGKHALAQITGLHSHPVIMCLLVSSVRTELSSSVSWVNESHML